MTPPSTTGGGGPWWVGVLLIALVLATYVVYYWRVNVTHRHERRVEHPAEQTPSVHDRKAA